MGKTGRSLTWENGSSFECPQVEVGAECSAEYLGLGDTQVGELFQSGPCSLLWSAMDSCC